MFIYFIFFIIYVIYLFNKIIYQNIVIKLNKQVNIFTFSIRKKNTYKKFFNVVNWPGESSMTRLKAVNSLFPKIKKNP